MTTEVRSIMNSNSGNGKIAPDGKKIANCLFWNVWERGKMFCVHAYVWSNMCKKFVIIQFVYDRFIHVKYYIKPFVYIGKCIHFKFQVCDTMSSHSAVLLWADFFNKYVHVASHRFKTIQNMFRYFVFWFCDSHIVRKF